MKRESSLSARLAALPGPEPPPRIGIRLRAKIDAEETAWRRETVCETFADGRQIQRSQATGFREEIRVGDSTPSQRTVRQETRNGITLTHSTYV